MAEGESVHRDERRDDCGLATTGSTAGTGVGLRPQRGQRLLRVGRLRKVWALRHDGLQRLGKIHLVAVITLRRSDRGFRAVRNGCVLCFRHVDIHSFLDEAEPFDDRPSVVVGLPCFLASPNRVDSQHAFLSALDVDFPKRVGPSPTRRFPRDLGGGLRSWRAVRVNRGAVLVNRGPVLVNRGPVLVNRSAVLVNRGPVLVNRGPVLVNRRPVRLRHPAALVVFEVACDRSFMGTSKLARSLLLVAFVTSGCARTVVTTSGTGSGGASVGPSATTSNETASSSATGSSSSCMVAVCEPGQCGFKPGCGGGTNCGTCDAPDTCGGGGVPNECGCISKSCSELGFDCATTIDNCGKPIDCGACAPCSACGGGGKPNVCGPACCPKTCADLGLNCGMAGDGCGNAIDCGTCAGQCGTCGGGGIANQCGAECCPETCAELGANCGIVNDGCDTTDCGSCPACETCGGSGIPNVCGAPPCSPKTCPAQGIQCGLASDGCCGTLNCGGCPTGETCGGGGAPGVCG